MTTRSVGVEEELLLVDPESNLLRAVSHVAVDRYRQRSSSVEDGSSEDASSEGGADLEQELFLQQLETGTAPCVGAGDLRRSLLTCRAEAAAAAAMAGAALVAVGTPVLAGGQDGVTPKPRYQRIVQEFGEIGRQGSVCGTHVHVDVRDDEEGVHVIDALRPWLPVLRAMSVNSPYWHGRDTGYASWRSQVWGRWPSAGPSDLFGDAANYHAAAAALIDTGAALDEGMLYYDARLSRSYPTVEVRVFDAMTEPDDVVLLALLTRALVSTAAGGPPVAATDAPSWRHEMLRAAHWRASRDGLSRNLLDPLTAQLRPARHVVHNLLGYVAEALREAGDAEEVTASFDRLIARGTGAARQRAAAERGGMDAAMADLRARFDASYR